MKTLYNSPLFTKKNKPYYILLWCFLYLVSLNLKANQCQKLRDEVQDIHSHLMDLEVGENQTTLRSLKQELEEKIAKHTLTKGAKELVDEYQRFINELQQIEINGESPFEQLFNAHQTIRNGIEVSERIIILDELIQEIFQDQQSIPSPSEIQEIGLTSLITNRCQQEESLDEKTLCQVLNNGNLIENHPLTNMINNFGIAYGFLGDDLETRNRALSAITEALSLQDDTLPPPALLIEELREIDQSLSVRIRDFDEAQEHYTFTENIEQYRQCLFRARSEELEICQRLSNDLESSDFRQQINGLQSLVASVVNQRLNRFIEGSESLDSPDIFSDLQENEISSALQLIQESDSSDRETINGIINGIIERNNLRVFGQFNEDNQQVEAGVINGLFSNLEKLVDTPFILAALEGGSIIDGTNRDHNINRINVFLKNLCQSDLDFFVQNNDQDIINIGNDQIYACLENLSSHPLSLDSRLRSLEDEIDTLRETIVDFKSETPHYTGLSNLLHSATVNYYENCQAQDNLAVCHIRNHEDLLGSDQAMVLISQTEEAIEVLASGNFQRREILTSDNTFNFCENARLRDDGLPIAELFEQTCHYLQRLREPRTGRTDDLEVTPHQDPQDLQDPQNLREPRPIPRQRPDETPPRTAATEREGGARDTDRREERRIDARVPLDQQTGDDSRRDILPSEAEAARWREVHRNNIVSYDSSGNPTITPRANVGVQWAQAIGQGIMTTGIPAYMNVQNHRMLTRHLEWQGMQQKWYNAMVQARPFNGFGGYGFMPHRGLGRPPGMFSPFHGGPLGSTTPLSGSEMSYYSIP